MDSVRYERVANVPLVLLRRKREAQPTNSCLATHHKAGQGKAGGLRYVAIQHSFRGIRPQVISFEIEISLKVSVIAELLASSTRLFGPV
jgi:hypothetical protein